MRERIEREEGAWHRGDVQGKAAPLPDTVRGRAEHGGQGMGKHFVVTLTLRLVIEDSIGAAPGRGAQRFNYKSGVALISAFTATERSLFVFALVDHFISGTWINFILTFAITRES